MKAKMIPLLPGRPVILTLDGKEVMLVGRGMPDPNDGQDYVLYRTSNKHFGYCWNASAENDLKNQLERK